jgi:hypothetical protein
MVRVHAEAPLTLTRAAIEKMVESSTGGRRTIINVGSLASILAVPGASAYVGTKAFLLAFSECVALELAGLDINVQVLLPGYFRSDFHRDMDLSEDEKRSRGLIRWMSAERVARSSVDAALRRRPPVIHVPGTANRVAYTVARLLPRRLLHALARRHFDDSRSTE